ncbi:hypothetical protein [Prosthecobacter sp.]|uniref:hypothetical protein n=1 Tax=Prosthecobacter sp. TaxID=1965333 RepID=UPI0037845E8C
MKTFQLVLMVCAFALSFSSCVGPVYPVGGVGVGVGTGYYTALPPAYRGPYYHQNNRYYYGGRYEPGRFPYNGHYYNGRYFHGGHYLYGGRHYGHMHP